MLRPYQQNAVDQIRRHYASGTKKVLLHLATGGGKTVVFSHILKSVAEKKRPALMLVRGRHLVEQASERLRRENVNHGVIMAGHWLSNPSALIQICSIDTISRRKIFPVADLIVVDEAHMATSDSFKKVIEHYQDQFILGVTATPFPEKSIRHIAQVVVKPITVKELVEQKFLVPLRYFAPRTPDLSKVKTIAGEFDAHDLSKIMNEQTLVGDIASEWTKHAQGRPTIIFAVDISHSNAIAKAFNSLGISCVHVEADTPLAVRQKHINDLRSGELKIISNVGVLCTGVDIPHLSCIVTARPTKSYNLHIQQLGRGTRIFDGKKDCLILDHAGNVTRHGFIDEERPCDLDGAPDKENRPTPITCLNCYAVFFPLQIENKGLCPMCGEKYSPEQERKSRELMRIDGDLVEIRELTPEQKILKEIAGLKREAKMRNYKKGWAYYQLVAKHGQEIADKFMPKRKVPDFIKRKLGRG